MIFVILEQLLFIQFFLIFSIALHFYASLQFPGFFWVSKFSLIIFPGVNILFLSFRKITNINQYVVITYNI